MNYSMLSLSLSPLSLLSHTHTHTHIHTHTHMDPTQLWDIAGKHMIIISEHSTLSLCTEQANKLRACSIHIA